MAAPSRLRRRLGSLALLLLASQAQPLAAAPAEGEQLETIVVTARFREDKLLDSTGSISVIDAGSAAARGAEHLESVLALSPNISTASGASRARFVQVRGVGDLEQFLDPKHFPSVGISLDEISLGSSANAAMLLDTQQVEVMRGPQGTRFGTSALAGMVSILGKEPTRDFEGSLSAGGGNYGAWQAGGVLSGPLSDRVSGRIAVRQHRGDGYIRNTYLGADDTNGYDELSARARLRFDASDRATYTLTLLQFDGDNGYDAFSLDNNRRTLSDRPGHDGQRTQAAAARGVWDLGGDRTLSATGTWSDSDLRYGFDEDWTFEGICDGTLCDPVLDFYSNTDDYRRDRRDASLDLRLLGGAELTPGAWRYVLGAYAQRLDEGLHRQYYGAFRSDYATDRDALYGQLETALTDSLTLTAGLRLERFEDDYDDSNAFTAASDDNLWSGELSLAYTTPAGLWYATLARGTKAGTINTQASANLAFMQPQFQSFMGGRLRASTESLLNAEAGFKGSLLDDRLQLRLAAFRMDRRDAQLESWMWDDVGFLWIGYLDNLDGDNQGLEAEVAWQATERLNLFASAGLLDTSIDAIQVFDLDQNAFVTRRNIDQAKSPDWQFNAGFNLALLDALQLRVEAEGRDDSQYGYYHAGTIDGYVLVHASLTWSSGPVTLRLWGRNLTDKDYAVHGLYFGNDPRKGWVNENYWQYGEPRIAGLSLDYQF